jgi:uncharacterized membrane protein
VGGPNAVAEQFKGYGGTILRTTLNPDQQAKVESVLNRKATSWAFSGKWSN